MKYLPPFVAVLLSTMATGSCGTRPAGSDDAGSRAGCDQGGLRHPEGSTFPSSDGCNTCTCLANGTVACTLRACVADASADATTDATTDAAVDATADSGTTVCTPRQDRTCNEDPSVITPLGTCLSDGTCSCSYARQPSLYTGKCLNLGDQSGNGCEYGGVLYPVMPEGVGGFACNSPGPCYCVAPGKIVTNPAGQVPAACPLPADVACARLPPTGSGYGKCAPTWSEIAADTGNCGLFIGDYQQDCGQYKVRGLVNVDVGFLYYYDATSGALVAIVSLGNPGIYRCFGGPADFSMPTACTPMQQIIHPCP